jgi:hypothetical protein
VRRLPALRDAVARRYRRSQAILEEDDRSGDMPLRRLVVALLESNPSLRERDRLLLKAEFLAESER